MREHPNNDRYDVLGYKRRVEMVYRENINTTFVKEYIYNPEEEDEIDREINHYDVCMYPGKPDMKKTKSRYKTVKTILWEESVEGVEYIEWKPPEPYKLIWDDELSDEDYVVPEEESSEILTAVEAARRHACDDSEEIFFHNWRMGRMRELRKIIDDMNE